MRLKRWGKLGLSLLVIELFLRAMEDPFDIDSLFNWSFWDTQAELIFIQHTQNKTPRIPITEGGFRGKWNMTPKAPNRLRIITTGAGHTFADNIDYGKAWPEILEHTLKGKGLQADIWNLAVNGSTVIFTHRILLEEIIKAKPDIVILSHSGYNEAIYSDLPDRSVVFQNPSIRNALFSFALVRSTVKYSSRAWNLFTQRPREPKVGIQEFKEVYRDIIQTLAQHDIFIILLQQEVITPSIPPFWIREDLEKYRDAFREIARDHALPILDPKTLCAHHPEPYFDDREYYSALMHQTLSKQLLPLIEITLP